MKIWNNGKKICAGCDSKKTRVRKNGYSQWYFWDSEYLCQTCYDRYIWHPISSAKHNHVKNPKRISFRNKRIVLDKDPRKGICKMCGRRGLTHMHHYKYDRNKPEKYTIELCPSCHAKEGHRLKQLVPINSNKK